MTFTHSPAVLARLPGGDGNDTFFLIGTREASVGVVLHGAAEEGLARVTRQASKMH